VAPFLTIFIGGNHEASNYLQSLPFGGWVALNIYYLGYAGVIKVNGIRIGGISGIYRRNHYEKGHFETPPYDGSTMRSVYAIRSLEVYRLRQITPDIDIMLSHDWPRRIWEYGNKEQLLQSNPSFRNDVEKGRLGSGPSMNLLMNLKPRYWFAAHMHCRFDAEVHNEGHCTKFTALDECLPNRQFLEILKIGGEVEGDLKIEYDLEWLSILYSSKGKLNPSMRDITSSASRQPTDIDKQLVLDKFNGDLTIPRNFIKTAREFSLLVDSNVVQGYEEVLVERIPQTIDFCQKLGIDEPFVEEKGK